MRDIILKRVHKIKTKERQNQLKNKRRESQSIQSTQKCLKTD